MTVAAVLFDMDGLLIDSEPVWYAVESVLADSLGGRWGPEHQEKCIGGTLRATSEYIAKLTSTDRSVESIMDEFLARMSNAYVKGLPINAGALELVDAVRAAGVATALVSSTYRVLLDAALVHLGRDRFDVTIAGDEVPAGKPDPAPYLLACTRLGVEPASTVVLEDAMNGVRSAEAAGCVVVVIPSHTSIDAGPRRHVRRSLAEIDPLWLLGLAA